MRVDSTAITDKNDTWNNTTSKFGRSSFGSLLVTRLSHLRLTARLHCLSLLLSMNLNPCWNICENQQLNVSVCVSNQFMQMQWWRIRLRRILKTTSSLGVIDHLKTTVTLGWLDYYCYYYSTTTMIKVEDIETILSFVASLQIIIIISDPFFMLKTLSRWQSKLTFQWLFWYQKDVRFL
jgi:hypothetical protein